LVEVFWNLEWNLTNATSINRTRSSLCRDFTIRSSKGYSILKRGKLLKFRTILISYPYGSIYYVTRFVRIGIKDNLYRKLLLFIISYSYYSDLIRNVVTISSQFILTSSRVIWYLIWETYSRVLWWATWLIDYLIGWIYNIKIQVNSWFWVLCYSLSKVWEDVVCVIWSLIKGIEQVNFNKHPISWMINWFISSNMWINSLCCSLNNFCYLSLITLLNLLN